MYNSKLGRFLVFSPDFGQFCLFPRVFGRMGARARSFAGF